MGFDRALRNPEFNGNVFAGPPLREIVRYFPFTGRQAAQRGILGILVFLGRVAFQHGNPPCSLSNARGILHDLPGKRTCQF